MSLASWALSQKIQEFVLSGHPAWPGMLWLCPSHEGSAAASMVWGVGSGKLAMEFGLPCLERLLLLKVFLSDSHVDVAGACVLSNGGRAPWFPRLCCYDGLKSYEEEGLEPWARYQPLTLHLPHGTWAPCLEAAMTSREMLWTLCLANQTWLWLV